MAAEWISGRNPVFEVLAAGRRRVHRLRLAQGAQIKGRLGEILQLCKARGVQVEQVPRGRFSSLGSGHQGVALEVGPYPYLSFAAILDQLPATGELPLVLLLDAIQDPQNLATLLRTAECVGVHGVILPPRRAASVTPAVVQASSGACEHLSIAQTNLAQAIRELQARGVWVVGLESTPESLRPDQVELNIPLAFVVGSEGQGLRRLVRASCDYLLALPMRGQVGSLNAAVAGSVALYLAWQARGFGGSG